MTNVNDIRQRMAACIETVDQNLDAYRRSRKEQTQLLEELAGSIDVLGGSVGVYEAKMDRNYKSVAHINALAHRLEDIVTQSASA